VVEGAPETEELVKRLTISVRACTETLALLVAMAWADGTLDKKEKDGIRDAADTLNLPKELRERLEGYMEEAPPLDDLKLGTMGLREREFAYVASAWMAWISEGIVEDEQALLNDIADELEIDEARQAELAEIATSLRRPLPGESWSKGIERLFRAIVTKVEAADEDSEVAFE
jgi:uncharacterized membrane protein YebE (DUF533 family)